MIRRLVGACEPAPAEISWEEDYALRVNPTLMTALLHDAVPVLKHVGWRVTKVEEGYCESELPLNLESTNQHGTHQAALIGLSGDYTGGLALATLLRNVPLAGVHPCNESNSAALWLASMNIRYKAPSTGHLTACCRVPEETAQRVRERYFGGRRLIVPLTVTFISNSESIAEAEMTYFAQASQLLRPTPENPRLNTLYKHKLKASARLIAALRAKMGDEERGLRIDSTEPLAGAHAWRIPQRQNLSVDDSGITSLVPINGQPANPPQSLYVHAAHSAAAAGPHGRILADYLTSILPQLEDMVVARTRHIDATLEQAIRSGVQQVVIPGVGLDFRVYSIAAKYPHVRFFETDLSEMLEERERTLRTIPYLPNAHRETVAVNFEVDQLDEKLLGSTSFDPRLPTMVVYEGCSMYFDEATNRRTLSQIRRLVNHPGSHLWSDFVSTAVVDGTTDQAGIEGFLAGMEKLGEAFVFGVDDVSSFFSSQGFTVRQALTAGEFLGQADPVYGVYRFVVAGPDGHAG